MRVKDEPAAMYCKGRDFCRRSIRGYIHRDGGRADVDTDGI